jgi:ATP-dependent protease ClpP protease subunit
MEFFNLGEQRTKDFVLSHTKMTEEFYDQHFDTELYMYADRAKELGIVDKIIGEDVELEDVI